MPHGLSDSFGVTPSALIYHDVVAPETAAASGFAGPGPDRYKLTPPLFAAHVEALLAAGVPVDLTFDDGGRSAADTIAPLLERHGLRGRFFVVTDRIGTDGFVEAAALLRLHDAGHVVGSHSATHRVLTGLDDDELEGEWRESREALAEILGAPPGEASVPRGYYDRRIAQAAAVAGYRTLFTSEPWTRPRTVDGLEVRGRFAVTRGTSPERAVALARGRVRTRAGVAAPWYARKAAKRALGPAYERLRVRILA
jgi:peptidoglycan/xylan/chitin deacetylase (PgdA/CDA1 family)